jgi:hypothetical protein
MKRLFQLTFTAIAIGTLSLVIAACGDTALLDDIADRVEASDSRNDDSNVDPAVDPASSWTGKSLVPLAMGSGGAGAYGTIGGKPVFMAVYGDTYYFNKSVSSSNGIDWISSSLPSSEGWRSIAYGNDCFIAVSVGIRDWSNPSSVVTNPTTAGAYSTNGSSWTANIMPSGKWTAVCYDQSNNRFVAVSEESTSAYSSNGTTWTSGGTVIISPTAMASGGGKLVAIRNGSTATSISADGGNSWSSGGSLPSAAVSSRIAYGNGKFVSVGGVTDSAAVSSDGSSWTTVTLPSSGYWTSLAFGNGLFMAISSDTQKAIVSSNGSSWLQYDLPAHPNGNTYSIALCGGGVFVALGLQWVATSP